MDNPSGSEWTSAAWLVSTAAAAVLLTAFVRRSGRILGSGLVESHAQNEYAYGVALRSAVIYVMIAVPPLLLRCGGPAGEQGVPATYSFADCVESPYKFFPKNLMRIYHWLPFWYGSMIVMNLSAWLNGTWQVLAGSGIAVFAVSFINYLMPGGAGTRPPEPEVSTYSMPAVMLYSIIFVYAIFVSRTSVGTKQYALGFFSSLIVPFMDPATDKGFRAVLVDWNMHLNWKGKVMCEVWIFLLAIVLSGFALGLYPWSKHSIRKCSCVSQSAKELLELAQDTHRCLKYFVDNYSASTNAVSFDADTVFVCIRRLGERRTRIDGLLAQAAWECHTPTARARLGALRRFADLLCRLRQVLRVEWQQARRAVIMFQGAWPACPAKVPQHLEDFLGACSEALTGLGLACCDCHGIHAPELDRDRVADAVKRAEVAIKRALEELGTSDDGTSTVCATAFVDHLRSWPAFLQQCVNHLELLHATTIESLFEAPSVHPAGSSWRDRHWYSLRNTSSWTLSLLWCVFKRGYSSGCVVSTSYIFSITSGSSFDKNINRMVGVGMGLAVGNVPAIFVTEGLSEDSPYYKQAIFIYFFAMFIMWFVPMYGYLAPGSKYSYACLMWVGYGSVHMLRHVPNFDRTRGLFYPVFDNFISCLIVFIVDALFAYCLGTGTTEKVRASVISCMQHVRTILSGLSKGEIDDASINNLREQIKVARFWDKEVRQEGFIWTALWEAPYQKEFVQTLLARCDDVYVAAFAIMTSAERCSDKNVASRIFHEMLPSSLSASCDLYVGAISTMLSGSRIDTETAQAFMAGRPLSKGAATFKSLAAGSQPETIAAATTLMSSVDFLCTSFRRLGGFLAAEAYFHIKESALELGVEQASLASEPNGKQSLEPAAKRRKRQ